MGAGEGWTPVFVRLVLEHIEAEATGLGAGPLSIDGDRPEECCAALFRDLHGHDDDMRHVKGN